MNFAAFDFIVGGEFSASFVIIGFNSYLILKGCIDCLCFERRSIAKITTFCSLSLIRLVFNWEKFN